MSLLCDEDKCCGIERALTETYNPRRTVIPVSTIKQLRMSNELLKGYSIRKNDKATYMLAVPQLKEQKAGVVINSRIRVGGAVIRNSRQFAISALSKRP